MLPSFFKNLGPISIDQIKQSINCDIRNISKNKIFNELVGTKNTTEKSLTFLYDSEKPEKKFTENTFLICTEKKYKHLNNKSQKALIVNNVQEAVAKLSNLFYRDYNRDEISEFDDAKFGKNCILGENSIVENGSIIGNDVIIESGTYIGHNCIIGDKTKIEQNTVITNSIIGQNVRIGRNCSIGQSGFGFFLKNDQNIDIFHVGIVIIKSFVSIGAGCAIDRGNFDDTIIGENSYFDNLCHIAHNVQIGRNSAFAAMSGIAGSTKIGNNVLAGGQVGIAGHLCIGDNVQIAAKSGVFNDLDDKQTVMGNPAINKYNYIKAYKKTYGKK